jgi:hypothetical protein
VTLTAGIVWLLSAATGSAQAINAASRLDFFLTDGALWRLTGDELVTRLEPAGYVVNPQTGVISLGEPADLMKRRAHLFVDSLAVWNVHLNRGDSLRWAQLSLLPPVNLGTLPDKAAFRNAVRTLETEIDRVLQTKSAPHPYDAPDPGKFGRATCQRWIGRDVQAVLTTLAAESRGAFTPQRLELRLAALAPPSEPPAKKPVPAVNRTTGVVLLEGFPPLPEWPGRHADWAVLEQALAATGKPADRNGIIEYFHYGVSWPETFVQGTQRLAAMSGVKLTEIVPLVHTVEEKAKLTRNCAAAAKKLGRQSPQVLQNLVDVDPEVLRMARTGGSAIPQFSAAVKLALTGGRPVYWYGWRGIFPEVPPHDGPPGPVIRLIIGLDGKAGEVVFAAADGSPGIRMNLAAALAASLYAGDVGGK